MDEGTGVDLSALIGNLSPIIEAVKSNPGLVSGALSLFKPAGETDAAPPPPPPKGRESDRRKLLHALAPYLSPERQKILSTILPLLEAWESVAPLIAGLRPAAGKE